MKQKLLDRLITTLSWVPSGLFGMPLIVIFVVAPAVYMGLATSDSDILKPPLVNPSKKIIKAGLPERLALRLEKGS